MNHLQTTRLYLGELLDTDTGSILALRSDPRVNQYLDRTPMQTMEEAGSFLGKIQKGYAENNAHYWAIRTEKNGVLIGTICLWNFSENNTTAELGYEMRPDFQGKGYMAEAINEVVGYAFEKLKLQKLSAYTHKLNQPSAHLLKKAGFSGPFETSVDYPHNDFIFILEQPSF